MSGTIALRNLLLVGLLGLVAFAIAYRRSALAVPVANVWDLIPWTVRCWVVFLFLFPLWAMQGDVAWQNLTSQWLESVVAGMIGFGAVLLMGKRGPTLRAMALASLVPIAVLFLLCLAAFEGALSPAFYIDPTLATVWSSLSDRKSWGTGPVFQLSDLLLGFRGVEPMHGNLGYTACQAIALLSVSSWMSVRNHDKLEGIKSLVLTAMGFMGVLIAHSRGALLYAVLIVALGSFVYWFKMRRSGYVSFGKVVEGQSVGRFSIGIAVGLIVFVAMQTIRHDERWLSMADKVELGVLSDQPLVLLCEGISPESEVRIREKFSSRDPAYIDALLNGLKQQDGGRILLMRVGFDLVLENFRGLDGSRHSYRKLIVAKCGREPALQFAHSHQGWIDLALALGWPGLGLFALMMGKFFLDGARRLSNANSEVGEWAMALVLLSAFWVTRGFADSVYREHYLQMQMLLLSYIYGRLILAETVPKNVDSKKVVEISR